MKNKKKTIKIVALLIGAGILIAGGVGFYMFNKPARDVQKTKTDFSYNASDIVSEYLTDAQKANNNTWMRPAIPKSLKYRV